MLLLNKYKLQPQEIHPPQNKLLSRMVLLALIGATAVGCAPPPPSMPSSVFGIEPPTGLGGNILPRTAETTVDFEALTNDFSSATRFAFEMLYQRARIEQIRGNGDAFAFFDVKTLDKFNPKDAPLPPELVEAKSGVDANHFLAIPLPDVSQQEPNGFSDWVLIKPSQSNPAVVQQIESELVMLTPKTILENPALLTNVLAKMGKNSSGIIVRGSYSYAFDPSMSPSSTPNLATIYNRYILSLPSSVRREYLTSYDPTRLLSDGQVATEVLLGYKCPIVQRIPPGGRTLLSFANSQKQIEMMTPAQLNSMFARFVEESSIPVVTGAEFNVMVLPANNDLTSIGMTSNGRLFISNAQYQAIPIGQKPFRETYVLEPCQTWPPMW